MDINFDDEDIERIAGHLNVPVDKFVETYLEADDENGRFKARQKPLPVSRGGQPLYNLRHAARGLPGQLVGPLIFVNKRQLASI